MTGARVLVIDDSTTLRKLVEIAMRGTGCAVDFAANGSDGVSLARSTRPDVILLDYLLPDLQSAEVCRRLSDDAATSQVPVVVMSANHRGVLDAFRGFPTVVDFVGKPFTPNEIRSRLASAMRTTPTRRAPAASEVRSSASATDESLVLRGDLVATPALELLRLVCASDVTGVLAVDLDPPLRAFVRRGAIVMCSTTAPDPETLRSDVPPELAERARRDQALGKPALITLAEGGLVRVSDLAVQLHARGTRLLGALLDARAGRYTWQSAASLPDFVAAFGRPLSVTSIALAHHRRAAAAIEPALPDEVYDRTSRFSAKLAGAHLTAEEQRVLALIDGTASVRAIAARAELAPERTAAIVARFREIDLIGLAHASVVVEAAGVVVLDPDRDEFAVELRAHLGRRVPPVPVVELDSHHELARRVLESRPRVVLLNASQLTAPVIERELPPLVRDGTLTLAGVLDAPDPAETARVLGAGVHVVLTKPIHISDVDRLLLP